MSEGARTGFGVLFVCTANQARSPMAHLMLTRIVSELHLPWSVSSAGTAVTRGVTTVPRATGQVLGEIGIATEGFSPRALTPQAIAQADVILTAEISHRHQVVRADPSSHARTFTMLQFARYCSAVEVGSADVVALGPDLLRGVGLARSRFQPAVAGADDIADPAGGGVREFRAARETIARAVEDIIRPLAASPPLASVPAAVEILARAGERLGRPDDGPARTDSHRLPLRKRLLRR